MKYLTLLITLLFLAFVTACTVFSPKDEVICDPVQNPGADESLICAMMSPSQADFTLMFANLEGIKNKIWTRQNAVDFFNDLESFLDAGATWSGLVVQITRRVTAIRDTFGVEIVFLSTYLEMPEFVEGGPISAYDIHLLKTHIQHQRDRVLALF